MKQKLKEWLDKGEGGEWFEPYVTNRDIVYVLLITVFSSAIIILGYWIQIELYYPKTK